MTRLKLHTIASLGLGGLAAELALTRHWQKWSQGLVWVFVLGLAAALWSLRPSAPASAVHRRRAVWLAALAALGSLSGVLLHVWGNLEAGPLDRVHGKGWEAMAWPAKLWLALTMRVGPAPALASGALLLLAALVWLLAVDDSSRKA